MNLMMVKLALVVFGLLGFGLWQLYDINRELKKDEGARQSAGQSAEQEQEGR